MDFAPTGTGRMLVGLTLLGIVALSAFFTMEPGKYRDLVWLLMGFFAVRILLTHTRARRQQR